MLNLRNEINFALFGAPTTITMDDGDILKPRTTHDVHGDISNNDEPDPNLKPDPHLMENRGGDFESLSDYDKHRFFLWSRTDVPSDVVRSKLSDVVDLDLLGEGVEEECIQVLQVLAKGFIAETIEEIRTRDLFSRDPIKPKELLEINQPAFKRAPCI